MNPMGNLWEILVGWSYADNRQLETTKALQLAISKEWSEVDNSGIKNLVNSMPERIFQKKRQKKTKCAIILKRTVGQSDFEADDQRVLGSPNELDDRIVGSLPPVRRRSIELRMKKRRDRQRMVDNLLVGASSSGGEELSDLVEEAVVADEGLVAERHQVRLQRRHT
uniref:Uncharacterized protein n=1 Tax=Heterorhabditis bacteriophora TaxID=37862 RepID=A0A1I7W697_HETBA